MSTTAEKKSQGLEGIIVGDSAVCSVEQGKLIYRGYDIADLAENAAFEEVAHLLLVGHKPSASELAEFDGRLKAARTLNADALAVLKSAASKPGVHPMDVLRTVVSFLAHVHPDAQDNSPEAELRKAVNLTGVIPTIIGHMQNVIDGRDIVAPDMNLSHAQNLYYMMMGEKPSEKAARIIDVSLILYAEHDFNASTFTSRVIAGTLADMHGAVTGAIAALKGPLHGGANEAAMEMIKEVGSVDNVEPFMKNAFETKRKIMGFGHRVYKNGDHRASILHELGRAYAEEKGQDAVRWFEIGEKIQKIMNDEKGIFPNVDFPCGLTYFVMGIPVPQYTPIFVAARITGWAAHIMEQHQNNRLIRPLSNYTGPLNKSWNDD